jgi:signal transduction histidine kinase
MMWAIFNRYSLSLADESALLPSGIQGSGMVVTALLILLSVAALVLLVVLIRARKAQVLERARLQERNAELESRLQQAQQQLQVQEKMASLGHLMASVAHEINTPIAAIKSSGRSIGDEFERTFASLPTLFQMLDAPRRDLFMQLVGESVNQVALLTTREERLLVASTAEQLDAEGVANARHKAGILVQLGAQGRLRDYAPLLHHPEAQFVIGIAHSLAMIVGNTKNINEATSRVTKLLQALKSFSHINFSEEMVADNLQQEIESVLMLYKGKLKSGVELVCDFAVVAPLPCFPDQLNQVWVNLIHNALQAMEGEGVLSIRLSRIGNEAVVSIADTGCGIEAANRSRIFEPFFTTKAAGVGTGLGLDIVKKIVERHHGRIELESEVGVGSTFYIHLPYGLPVPTSLVPR